MAEQRNSIRPVRTVQKNVELVIALLPAVDAGLALLESVPRIRPYARVLRRVTRFGMAQSPEVIRQMLLKT